MECYLVHNDGVTGHPVDGLAWKALDSQHSHFTSIARNVRIGLSTNGYNRFANMSIFHITWLVVLVPYNLSPWMCIKRLTFI